MIGKTNSGSGVSKTELDAIIAQKDKEYSEMVAQKDREISNLNSTLSSTKSQLSSTKSQLSSMTSQRNNYYNKCRNVRVRAGWNSGANYMRFYVNDRQVIQTSNPQYGESGTSNKTISIL